MSLYRCPGCQQYSSESNGELSGVIYTTRRFFDVYERKYEQDEEDNRCQSCGTDADEFEQIADSHVERLQRKLDIPAEDIAGYLNEQH